ncbi:MAG: cytochrome c3 family protein [Planctomycetota bacterium]
MLISEHSERESAKQRARRIPLDYYRQRTPLEKAKWRVSWLIGLIALAYSAYVVVGGQWLGWLPARAAMSPGPVTAAHQPWNDRCEECHEPGKTLREDSRGMRWFNQLLGLDRSSAPSAETQLVSASGAAADSGVGALKAGGRGLNAHPAQLDRCEQCHSGSLHHPRQVLGAADTCANCHRDHQGSTFNLRRMADRHCLGCHSEIEQHRRADGEVLEVAAGSVDITAGVPPVNVNSLAQHPTSRSLKAGDPGKLKFNHRLHQLPGQYEADAKTGVEKTLASIDRVHWTRLGYEPDSDPATVIQLNCAFCHESDEVGTPGASNALAIPASGAYMLPIQYERHCGMCHDQDLNVSVPKEQGVVSGRVAHGLKATEVSRLVWGLTVASDAELAQLNTALKPPRAIPGQSDDALTKARGDDVLASKVQQVLSKLQEQQCGKCHLYPTTEASPAGLREILPTAIPSVWYQVARFDHSAHRAVACAECHAAEAFLWPADKSGKPPLDDPTPIIPDIDTGRRCHGATTEQTAARASGDCVECHDYHSAYLAPGERAKARHALPLLKRQSGSDWMGDPAIQAPATKAPATTAPKATTPAAKAPAAARPDTTQADAPSGHTGDAATSTKRS